MALSWQESKGGGYKVGRSRGGAGRVLQVGSTSGDRLQIYIYGWQVADTEVEEGRVKSLLMTKGDE